MPVWRKHSISLVKYDATDPAEELKLEDGKLAGSLREAETGPVSDIISPSTPYILQQLQMTSSLSIKWNDFLMYYLNMDLN